MTRSPDRAPRVLGRTVDEQTRCVHYGGPLDVVALQFKCCGDFYPCYECHEEAVSHPAQRWNVSETGEAAVLCGVCGHRLSIGDYLRSESCPGCSARFNPRCSLHHHLYFDLPGLPRPAERDFRAAPPTPAPTTPAPTSTAEEPR